MTRTVLITGCSSGFGEATPCLFAARGWNVVATMRSPGAGGEFAALDRVLVTRLDVQDPASIEAAVAAAIDRFGRIDVLVNNAGFGLFGVFESTPREKVLGLFAVSEFNHGIHPFRGIPGGFGRPGPRCQDGCGGVG
ncbi:SDR family NAD(P)-dependent oxidoreductase [Azospirillum sp. Marseille-Q6669]